MTHGSLFSGIGGFDLAAEQVGWTNLFHCEWNPFCRRVLDYHFPNSESYDDIKETDFRKWQGKVDVLSGGFPCQPFSTAGLRKGSTDDRYLWPEMLRQLMRSDPLGLLVRMLLDSSQWYTPLRRLRWRAVKIYSERVTKSMSSEINISSSKSLQHLNREDIASNHLLYRLSPLEHRTAEIGSGLLPTPMTQGLKVQDEKGRMKPMSPMLLPTPTVQSARGNVTDNRKRGNLTDAIAIIYKPEKPREGEATFPLNPLYVEEMMGFPESWTLLPFLDGEQRV